MKNDHLPIIQALKGRQKPKSETPLPQFEAPRMIHVNHSEVPGLPGRKVGEPITVHVTGHVHSQHNEGHAIMHVSSVKPDTSGTEKKQYPEQKVPERGVDPVRVRTQQSHA